MMDGEALIERFKRENPDLYQAGILEALHADVLAAVKEGHSPEEALDLLAVSARKQLGWERPSSPDAFFFNQAMNHLAEESNERKLVRR